MNYKDLEPYYLCGIGSHQKIDYFRIGKFDKERESFSFPNGSYSNMELGRKPTGNNATYVVSAIPLQKIDDAELLYE